MGSFSCHYHVGKKCENQLLCHKLHIFMVANCVYLNLTVSDVTPRWWCFFGQSYDLRFKNGENDQGYRNILLFTTAAFIHPGYRQALQVFEDNQKFWILTPKSAKHDKSFLLILPNNYLELQTTSKKNFKKTFFSSKSSHKPAS